MAKFSMNKGGKEVGPASTYAQPHTMTGGTVDIKTAQQYKTDPNTMNALESAPGMPARRVSMGDPASTQMNKNGETLIRGCGAATKGTKARGPMA